MRDTLTRKIALRISYLLLLVAKVTWIKQTWRPPGGHLQILGSRSVQGNIHSSNHIDNY